MAEAVPISFPVERGRGPTRGVVEGTNTRGKPHGTAIHATAVAVDDFGLLILGPSRAGKSRLAAALIAAVLASGGPIRLVGDDRILLTRRGADLVARPHPRIAGFLERRGLGIVAVPFVRTVVVGGVIRLMTPASLQSARPTTPPPGGDENFPHLPLVMIDGTSPLAEQRDIVLGWWRDARTTPASKTTAHAASRAKV